LEWWHLQPIETNGIPAARRMSFLDKDDLIYGDDSMIDLTRFQTAAKAIGAYSSTIDGKTGPNTKAAAQEFLPIVQQILGLPDVQKTQLENIELKAKIKQINQISDI
jgi:peptidoglycan hydrolase-like protein with peptidoglycan-binding domain